MFSSNTTLYGPYAIVRILYFFFMTRLGRGILGAILLVAGIWYGLGSHMVHYQTGPTGQAMIYVAGDGTDYLYFSGNPVVYVIKAVDFTPYPNPASVVDLRAVNKLVYKAGLVQINSNQGDGTTLQAFGYDVSRFSYQDETGEDQGTYTSSEYSQHPTDYYANQWPTASILLGLGTFFLLLATLIPYWIDKIVWREKPAKSL